MMRGCLSLGLMAAARPVTPQETPPGAEALSGELDRAGIAGEDRARIGQALRTRAYDQAESLLLEAVKRAPRSPELLRLLGGVRFLRGQPLGAAIALKKAEALGPLDERSRFTLAMCYVTMNRPAWARPELRALADAAPRNPLYVYWTARLDYDEGHYLAALAGMKRAVEIDAGFVKGHDYLGLSYEALGRSEEAVLSYETALRLNRTSSAPSPWPGLNLGLLRAREGRFAEAEALFRESLRADPGFPQGHYQLGVILEKEGRYDEGTKELEQAVTLDPAYPEPQYALARIYRRRGDAERADRALEEFQRLKKEKGQTGSGR